MTKPLMTPDEVAVDRFNMIAPLTAFGIDKGRRSEVVREITGRSGISERTLKRYLSAWEEKGFEGLKPKSGWERPDSRLGDDFSDIVSAAIELRMESPARSVSDIIKILELEEVIPEGSVSRSTLQRHLAAKGYAASQVRMYTKKGAAARRFRKEHRCELFMSDIKYGPFVPGKDGKKHQIYLVVWQDNATRFIVSARFYEDQTVSAIEDSLRRAIQKYGVPDKIFTDQGKQYKSKWLSGACAKLGIRLLRARPYHAEAKGAIEVFNRTVGKMISEAALKKLSSVGEYNEFLKIWLDEYYHKNPHAGLGGISPAAAFGTDSRPLRFVSAEALKEAFLHAETRKVDKSGCVSFQGSLYEVGVCFIGRKVGIRFDPSWADEIEIHHEDTEPFLAKKLVIGRNCGVKQALPESMRLTDPESSRMLDALKKKHLKNRQESVVATTFKEFWEGNENV